MTGNLKHRGPNGDGYHSGMGTGLGHRRLAMIDLATGDQPLYSEDRTTCGVFNGEIHNVHSLVTELGALEEVFKSQSGTEVNVHTWEESGVLCPDRFHGMFAFLLWDDRQKLLFVTRDRLAEKLLFCAISRDGRLLFASELKSRLLCDQIDRQQAIDDFFVFGYVPDSRLIYGDIRKLAPGHYLCNRGDGVVSEPRAHWDVQVADAGCSFREEEIEEELTERVRSSVRKRMISDVPLGMFLSGVHSNEIVSEYRFAVSAYANSCKYLVSNAFEKVLIGFELNPAINNHHVKTINPSAFDLLDRPAKGYEPFGMARQSLHFEVVQSQEGISGAGVMGFRGPLAPKYSDFDGKCMHNRHSPEADPQCVKQCEFKKSAIGSSPTRSSCGSQF